MAPLLLVAKRILSTLVSDWERDLSLGWIGVVFKLGSMLSLSTEDLRTCIASMGMKVILYVCKISVHRLFFDWTKDIVLAS